jgi:thioredoxin-like negative regulator of GroEL
MELDREFENRFLIYRVDVDAVPSLAETMGVRRVPEVVIFHEGEKVHSITGLQPKDTYRRAMHGISGPRGGSVLPDETTAEK